MVRVPRSRALSGKTGLYVHSARNPHDKKDFRTPGDDLVNCGRDNGSARDGTILPRGRYLDLVSSRVPRPLPGPGFDEGDLSAKKPYTVVFARGGGWSHRGHAGHGVGAGTPGHSAVAPVLGQRRREGRRHGAVVDAEFPRLPEPP